MRPKYTAIIAIFAIATIIGTVATYAYLSQTDPQPLSIT
ncbi:MAG: SipW-dependent-type signal peptide-containing protein [Candidatus Bathyarchaeia archaeon]